MTQARDQEPQIFTLPGHFFQAFHALKPSPTQTTQLRAHGDSPKVHISQHSPTEFIQCPFAVVVQGSFRY